MEFSRPEHLEWVAFPFSRGLSKPRCQTQVSCIAGGFFTSWVSREALFLFISLYIMVQDLFYPLSLFPSPSLLCSLWDDTLPSKCHVLSILLPLLIFRKFYTEKPSWFQKSWAKKVAMSFRKMMNEGIEVQTRDFCRDRILHKVVVLTSTHISSIIPQNVTSGHSHQDYVGWLLSMQILEPHCTTVSLQLDPGNLHFFLMPYFYFKATNTQILAHLFLLIS